MKEGDSARLKAPEIAGEIVATDGERVLLRYKVGRDTHERWFDRGDLELTEASDKRSAKRR